MSDKGKRPRLSGAQFRKQRDQRKEEDGRLAQSMNRFFGRSTVSAPAAVSSSPPSAQCETPAPTDSLSQQNNDDSSHSTPQPRVNNSSSETEPESVDMDVKETETFAAVNREWRANDTTETKTTQLAANMYEDAGLWPEPMIDAVRIDIVTRGSAAVQNKEGPFVVVERPCANVRTKLKGVTRSLTKDWFYRRLDNGEKMLRSWMVYSPVEKCLYCFCCRLFHKCGNHNEQQSS